MIFELLMSEESDSLEPFAPAPNALCLPTTDRVTFPAHKRAVTALAVDAGNARFITGGYDCSVRFFDFGGMDRRFRPFREIEPTDGSSITALSYTFAGDFFLASTAHLQIKLYNRDGRYVAGTRKGDMFIVDLKKTHGHVGTVTDVHFHPASKEDFLSSSIDGTIRVWDVNTMDATQKAVVKLYNATREEATCCGYAPETNLQELSDSSSDEYKPKRRPT